MAKSLVNLRKTNQTQQLQRVEVEAAEGLEDICKREIYSLVKKRDIVNLNVESGAIQLQLRGDIARLHYLHSAVAVYRVLYFDVPRPRALLGHEHFTRLVKVITSIMRGPLTFRTFHISAAGSETSVMNRLRRELAGTIDLKPGDGEGDLLLRIRRSRPGWDVLVRTTPRPLSKRDWRACDMEGALNAPAAYAMNVLAGTAQDDVYFNLMCGSGTLLIERMRLKGVRRALAADFEPKALGCTETNLEVAGMAQAVQVLGGDGYALPLADSSVDVITADLPFGQRVGSHQHNMKLYPAVLKEVHRICKPRGRFVLLTHEVRLMERTLDSLSGWQIQHVRRIGLRGMHPRIFVLRKA